MGMGEKEESETLAMTTLKYFLEGTLRRTYLDGERGIDRRQTLRYTEIGFTMTGARVEALNDCLI
jgi:hypothetical protein